MATSLGHDGVRGTAASPMTTAAPAPRAWRPPPSHAQILRAAGWLSPAGGADTLQYESLARSHDVVRVVRRDGARVVLRERDGCYVLSPRGWQLMTAAPEVEEVRLRFNRG